MGADQKRIIVMTRNEMGKSRGKYNGKFVAAITAGLEPAGNWCR